MSRGSLVKPEKQKALRAAHITDHAGRAGVGEWWSARDRGQEQCENSSTPAPGMNGGTTTTRRTAKGDCKSCCAYFIFFFRMRAQPDCVAIPQQSGPLRHLPPLVTGCHEPVGGAARCTALDLIEPRREIIVWYALASHQFPVRTGREGAHQIRRVIKSSQKL